MGLLAEAKDLCSKISTPGAGDRKTVAVWILCSVVIEATLNYAHRFAGLRLGYPEEQVSKYVRLIPNREKLEVIQSNFKENKE